MFMFLNKKIIAGIFSTLFVTSKSYADTAPLSTVEKIRELESSCICEFDDVKGSDFSCFTYVGYTFTMEFVNFGRGGSTCSVLNPDGSVQFAMNLKSSSTSLVRYGPSNSGGFYNFLWDPSENVQDGECMWDFSTSNLILGCWACPKPTDSPSTQPSIIFSDSPSNQLSDIPTDVHSNQPSDIPTDVHSNQPSDIPTDVHSNQPSDNLNPTDNVGNDVNTADDDGNDFNPAADNESNGECCCCDCSLFSSLKKLLLI